MEKTTKIDLSLELVVTTNKPNCPFELVLLEKWLNRENEKSVQSGTGNLYEPFSISLSQALSGNESNLFFYLHDNLIGFVRVVELQRGFWEIMSAISNPAFRSLYTGFNRLFQQEALLRIAGISRQRTRISKAVFIVTYHPAVAGSIRNMINASRAYRVQGNLLDFSRTRELGEAEITAHRSLLKLEAAGGNQKSFVFELGNCLQTLSQAGRKAPRHCAPIS